MANLKAAIKYIKKTARNRARNLDYKSRLKKTIKDFKAKPGKETLSKALSMVDKAALKGIIHKNNAARKKAQLMRMMSASK